MKKSIAYIFLIGMVFWGLKLFFPAQGPHHSDYEELVMEKMKEFRSYGDFPKTERYSNPDAFFLFDKLTRMNPQTGEVPPFGLLNAYKELKRDLQARGISNNAIVWDEKGPSNIGGRTRAVMFDPNDANNARVFAGGVGGGLWKNEDITSSTSEWVNVDPLFSNVAVTAVIADPSNPKFMYFGTGEGYRNADAIRGAGLWKSQDGGITWSHLEATGNTDFFYTMKLAMSADGQLYVATKTGLYKSADKGESFYKVLGNLSADANVYINDVEMASNGDVYAAVNGDGVYKSSSNHGANTGEDGYWVRNPSSFPSTIGRIEVACAPSDPNRVYAITESGSSVEGVYVTTDGGNSWASTGSVPGPPDFSNGQAWYDLCITVDPNNPDRLYVGAIDVYASSSSGAFWVQISRAYSGVGTYMHPDQHNIVFRPGSSSNIIFSNDGGIHYTPNSGQTINIRNKGYNITQFYSLAISSKAGSNLMLGGTQDNGTIRTNSVGIDEGTHVQGGDGSYCAINSMHPDTMFATTQYSYLGRSRNGGASFSSISNGNLNQGNTQFINAIEIDPLHPEYLFQASHHLWRLPNASTAFGNSWEKATALVSGAGISAISISENIPHLAYISAGGRVLRIPNSHQTDENFEPIRVGEGLPAGNIHCVAINPENGNHIIATFTSYGLSAQIWECKDAQLGDDASWRPLQGNLPDLPVNWAAFEPNNNDGMVIGTDLGVFRAGNISVNSQDIFWTPERNQLGFPRVEMIKARYSDNTVHISTHGRGFFSTNSYNVAPETNFGIVSDTACGGLIQFVDSSVGVNSEWIWDFGDGNQSSLQNPRHLYSVGGVYSVTLVSSNPMGTDTAIKDISIMMAPLPDNKVTVDTAVCPNGFLQLNASGGTDYLWIPKNSVDDPNSSHPVAEIQGEMMFIVQISNEFGCSVNDTVDVGILPSPSVWAGQDEEIVIFDSVQLEGFGGETYEWEPAHGLSCTDCPNPIASPDTTTEYTCTGYNERSCFASDKVMVEVNDTTVGRPIDSFTNGLTISYSNPFSGEGVIRLNSLEGLSGKISLINLKGQNVEVLWEGTNSELETYIQLDANKYASGLYFLSVIQKGKQSLKKIILN